MVLKQKPYILYRYFGPFGLLKGYWGSGFRDLFIDLSFEASGIWGFEDF